MMSNRRQILRALGLGGLAAPLFPRLEAFAGGGPTAPPVGPHSPRLLLVFSANGMVPERFWPVDPGVAWAPPEKRERDKREGAEKRPADKAGADRAAAEKANGAGAEKAAAPPRTIDLPLAIRPGSDLEPLAPFQSKLVVVRNLGRKLHKLGGAHERAMGALWTGARLNPGSQFGGGGWPAGPSVDQIIARGRPRATDFASLEVGVQPFGPGAKGGTMQHMCYAGSNQPIPSEGNPNKLFDRLFGGAAAGGPAFDRLRAERRSVMDVVRQEIARAGARVGRDDQRKLDAHLEAVRSIERRLETQPPSTCQIRTPQGELDLEANENFPILLKLQTDLLVSALACDRTRVASLQWSRSFSMVRHTWLGSNEGHHTLSHDSNERPILGDITRWYNQQLAYLLGELDKIPEGQGTALDNTLVVYCNELHTGWDHKPGPVPTLLAGGMAGHLRTGRYLDYGAGHFTHSNFLVSLCHAMGLPSITRVGDLAGPEGPLPHLFV